MCQISYDDDDDGPAAAPPPPTPGAAAGAAASAASGCRGRVRRRFSNIDLWRIEAYSTAHAVCDDEPPQIVGGATPESAISSSCCTSPATLRTPSTIAGGSEDECCTSSASGSTSARPCGSLNVRRKWRWAPVCSSYSGDARTSTNSELPDGHFSVMPGEKKERPDCNAMNSSGNAPPHPSSAPSAGMSALLSGWPTSAANDEPDILQNSIDAEMMVGGVSFEVITSCAVSEAIAT